MSVLSKVLRTCSLGLILTIFFNPLLVVAKRRLPPAPNTGTPTGKTTPGTTRPESACPITEKPLTALIANNGKDLTVTKYPTFFFYIPYTPEDISMMEFIIHNGTETVYHSEVKLEERSGIIKIEVPSSTIDSLAIDTNYYWRFNLNCQQNVAPDLFLEGWVRRVTLDFELENKLNSSQFKDYLVYQDRDIWYDAIASLAKLYFANPENKELTQEWNNTLKSLELDWVIDEPLVDSKIKH